LLVYVATLPLAAAYTLASLQSEINRWDSKYYSSNGKDPLVYLTVLLMTLQFR
jgi:nuclear pore complex protein Nup93